MMRNDPQSIDELIRRRVVDWRTSNGLTQDQLAARLWTVGLELSRSAVTAFERDGRKFSVGEFVLLCTALGTTPQAMLAGDETVRLTPQATAPLARVRHLLGKQSAKLGWRDVEGFEPATSRRREHREREAARTGAEFAAVAARLPGAKWVEAEEAAHLEAEVRAAGRLGLTPYEVASLAFRLWGQSLTDERDQRATERLGTGTPERSARMIRAHITTLLEKELRDALEGGSK
jgi:transcriptional regulator with XRE-family HTH domain